MLVLSRKVGERVVIGRNIVVTVVAVQGGRVKLGITAPRDVSIHREDMPCPVAPVDQDWMAPLPSDQSPFYAEFA